MISHRHLERHRSRSPRSSSHRHSPNERSRSPKPEPRHHHHHHRHDYSHDISRRKQQLPLSQPGDPPRPVRLPFQSIPLAKHDREVYKPLFASYLDIQKQLQLADLTEDQAKGRWKSFMGKWNRGELAEGWYDPTTKKKADASFAAHSTDAAILLREAGQGVQTRRRDSPDYTAGESTTRRGGDEASDADTDDYGPIPASEKSTNLPVRFSGAPAPTFEDLALRAETSTEDAEALHAVNRAARKAERQLHKERLEEVAPRAEPGTKERQLEKKRERGIADKQFREAGEGGGTIEIKESDLMGGSDDVRAMKKQEERKRNEREIRREEILRARAVEREERLRGMREKEEKAMEVLKAIARERYGTD